MQTDVPCLVDNSDVADCHLDELDSAVVMHFSSLTVWGPMCLSAPPLPSKLASNVTLSLSVCWWSARVLFSVLLIWTMSFCFMSFTHCLTANWPQMTHWGENRTKALLALLALLRLWHGLLPSQSHTKCSEHRPAHSMWGWCAWSRTRICWQMTWQALSVIDQSWGLWVKPRNTVSTKNFKPHFLLCSTRLLLCFLNTQPIRHTNLPWTMDLKDIVNVCQCQCFAYSSTFNYVLNKTTLFSDPITVQFIMHFCATMSNILCLHSVAELGFASVKH